MFRDGKDISEIATARSLTVGTIAGHLGEMVQLGEINLEDVIPSGIFTILDNAAKELTAEGRQPDYQALRERIPGPIPAHYLSLYARARR